MTHFSLHDALPISGARQVASLVFCDQAGSLCIRLQRENRECSRKLAELLSRPGTAPRATAAPWNWSSTCRTASWIPGAATVPSVAARSEEHTSELQSLMRISYAVFCLTKNK